MQNILLRMSHKISNSRFTCIQQFCMLLIGLESLYFVAFKEAAFNNFLCTLFRERPLPAILIKRRNLSKSPPLLTKLDTSPNHKHKSFRKTFTKATSKIFSRKSVTSKAINNMNAVVDASNQNALSSAGTKHESTGML